MMLMNFERRTAMSDDRDLPNLDYDREKVDETVLALLWLTLHDDYRAWKGHDWDVLARLHQRGYIDDPKNKAKSVLFTEEGKERSRELFARHFGVDAKRQMPRLKSTA
jgi:Domain of unknown function (DUF6429)